MRVRNGAQCTAGSGESGVRSSTCNCRVHPRYLGRAHHLPKLAFLFPGTAHEKPVMQQLAGDEVSVCGRGYLALKMTAHIHHFVELICHSGVAHVLQRNSLCKGQHPESNDFEVFAMRARVHASLCARDLTVAHTVLCGLLNCCISGCVTHSVTTSAY